MAGALLHVENTEVGFYTAVESVYQEHDQSVGGLGGALFILVN